MSQLQQNGLGNRTNPTAESNLMAHRLPFTPQGLSEFPAIFWAPKPKKNPDTGADVFECRTFNSPDDVPEGWIGTHPNNVKNIAPPPKPVAPEDPIQVTLTREEIIAELDAGEIAYSKRSGDKVLYRLLTDKLKEHLTAKGIVFAPNADARVLLALAKPE